MKSIIYLTILFSYVFVNGQKNVPVNDISTIIGTWSSEHSEIKVFTYENKNNHFYASWNRLRRDSLHFNKAYGKATWYLCNGGPEGGCDAYVKLELKGDSLKVQYPERIKDGNLYYSEVFGKSIN